MARLAPKTSGLVNRNKLSAGWERRGLEPTRRTAPALASGAALPPGTDEACGSHGRTAPRVVTVRRLSVPPVKAPLDIAQYLALDQPRTVRVQESSQCLHHCLLGIGDPSLADVLLQAVRQGIRECDAERLHGKIVG